LSFFTKSLLTFLLSMVPIIELRGAIPYGILAGLPDWYSIMLSVLGNILPVPFIILFIRKIFEFLRNKSAWLNKLVTKLEKRAEKKSATVQKYAFWGLFFLVAIPLPGTGAWTGSLVAAMLNMRLKKAFPAVALGVVGAAVIMYVLTKVGVIAFF